MKDIVLTTVNAKWIHPSLALRLLKANLGRLEERCEIIEFNLRQPLAEKTKPLLEANPRILGISVSIWNHLAAVELLKELEKNWNDKPVIVLGGPEVSHLPPEAEIFKHVDYVIRGEGETAFRLLCEDILLNDKYIFPYNTPCSSVTSAANNLCEIKPAYHLYTDEDLHRKLVYVESSRGCPFKCEFCLSSVKTEGQAVREFELDQFFDQMDTLIQRGAGTFKFLDRTFNLNIPRSLRIIDFFLDKIKNHSSLRTAHSSFAVPFVVHFEMIPLNFPPELIEALARFPPGTLRLEIGIQTLNAETAWLLKLPGRNQHDDSQKILKTLSLLRKKTNAIIHADLIAGLPGESVDSFGEGFDRLWRALNDADFEAKGHAEIQPGILKLLPGTPVSRHIERYKMRFNSLPLYEIEESSLICTDDLRRIKNFSRFWELIMNRGLVNAAKLAEKTMNISIFLEFLNLSDRLFDYFGKNWGIDKNELIVKLKEENFI